MWRGSNKVENLRTALATMLQLLFILFLLYLFYLHLYFSTLILNLHHAEVVLYFFVFVFFYLFPSCYPNTVACSFPFLRHVPLSPPSAAVTETHRGQAVRHNPDVESCRNASHGEGHVHSAGRTDRRFKGLVGWHGERREEEVHAAQPS